LYFLFTLYLSFLFYPLFNSLLVLLPYTPLSFLYYPLYIFSYLFSFIYYLIPYSILYIFILQP
jgi:hypothetical protein